MLTILGRTVTTHVLRRKKFFAVELVRARDPDSLKELTTGLQICIVFSHVSADLTPRGGKEMTDESLVCASSFCSGGVRSSGCEFSVRQKDAEASARSD